MNSVLHEYISNSVDLEWCLYSACTLMRTLFFLTILGEGKEEATCNADEGC